MVSLSSPKATPLEGSDLSSRNTKNSKFIFGLGQGITADDATIKGARQPTNRQVLRCLMYYTTMPCESTHASRTKFCAAKIVLTQVKSFYQRANIPMISDKKACQKMIKLLNDNAKLREIPKERRKTTTTRNKINNTEKKFDESFPLWPANAVQLIKNPDDLAFLKSIQGDRNATFGSKDKVLALKVKRTSKRKQLQEQRTIKEKTRLEKKCRVAKDTENFDSNEADSSTDESKDNIADIYEAPQKLNRSHSRVS